MISKPIPAPKGRPVSADATPKALHATQKILLTEGFGKLSVEKVASITGLGKPTLYRRWSNAGDLAMSALLEMAQDFHAPKGRTIESALLTQLRGIIAAFDSDWGRQVVLVIAACDPLASADFKQTLFLSSRDAGKRALESAIASGEIAPPPDLEALLDMIYAPILSRLLLGHLDLGAGLADALVQTALLACTKDMAKPKPIKAAPVKAAKPAEIIDLIEEPRQGSLF